jgi:hypothetical protein
LSMSFTIAISFFISRVSHIKRFNIAAYILMLLSSV